MSRIGLGGSCNEFFFRFDINLQVGLERWYNEELYVALKKTNRSRKAIYDSLQVGWTVCLWWLNIRVLNVILYKIKSIYELYYSVIWIVKKVNNPTEEKSWELISFTKNSNSFHSNAKKKGILTSISLHLQSFSHKETTISSSRSWREKKTPN